MEANVVGKTVIAFVTASWPSRRKRSDRASHAAGRRKRARDGDAILDLGQELARFARSERASEDGCSWPSRSFHGSRRFIATCAPPVRKGRKAWRSCARPRTSPWPLSTGTHRRVEAGRFRAVAAAKPCGTALDPERHHLRLHVDRLSDVLAAIQSVDAKTCVPRRSSSSSTTIPRSRRDGEAAPRGVVIAENRFERGPPQKDRDRRRERRLVAFLDDDAIADPGVSASFVRPLPGTAGYRRRSAHEPVWPELRRRGFRMSFCGWWAVPTPA